MTRADLAPKKGPQYSPEQWLRIAEAFDRAGLADQRKIALANAYAHLADPYPAHPYSEE